MISVVVVTAKMSSALLVPILTILRGQPDRMPEVCPRLPSLHLHNARP